MGRAQRRHHDQRMKRRFHRRERLHPYWGGSDKSAGRYANHGCDCSCTMCGNPRRHFGHVTLQESYQLDEHSAIKGIYDGDTDATCVRHCAADDLDQPCEAL